VYEVLKRWATEGHAGLDDKPSTPREPARKATMSAISEVRKMVVESPELGAYRERAALEQIGIHLSQATYGRLLALNRKLYGLPQPKGSAERPRKELPFKPTFRHEYWCLDVRYIEEHNLGFPEPVYLISVPESYSRAILASKISATQNQWDYLEVLFAALSTFGVPKALVSDGGGIFYCRQAKDVYAALSIEKLRIDPRQAWQNLIEAHFNIVRRMADAKFARATSWEEMLTIHRTWMRDYNVQRHWAHEKREDGCHSPAQVIGWHKGTMYPESVLNRILFATRYTRYLDKNGFLRFQNWKLYGERGLAKAPVTVWVYEGSLKVEYQAVTLSKYTVELQDDHQHVQAVSNPRLQETPFRLPQLTLFDLGPHEWLLYWKTPDHAPAHRGRRVPGIVQLPLFELFPQDLAVGADETRGAPRPRPFLHLVGEPGTNLGTQE
jgi:putative transposase